MPVPQSIIDGFAKIDQGLLDIAARIDALTAQIGTGMTQADVDAVAAQLGAEADKLEALAKPPVP